MIYKKDWWWIMPQIAVLGCRGFVILFIMNFNLQTIQTRMNKIRALINCDWNVYNISMKCNLNLKYINMLRLWIFIFYLSITVVISHKWRNSIVNNSTCSFSYWKDCCERWCTLWKKIFFTDETTFYISGTVNWHNCRIWSSQPLHKWFEHQH